MRAGSSSRDSEPGAEGDSQADWTASSVTSHSPMVPQRGRRAGLANCSLMTRQISGDKVGQRSSWEAKSGGQGWDQQGTRLDMATPCHHWPVHKQLTPNGGGEETTDSVGKMTLSLCKKLHFYKISQRFYIL